MAAELGDLFDLNKGPDTGNIALGHSRLDADDILKSYISLYLHEEIQMEGFSIS